MFNLSLIQDLNPRQKNAETVSYFIEYTCDGQEHGKEALDDDINCHTFKNLPTQAECVFEVSARNNRIKPGYNASLPTSKIIVPSSGRYLVSNL